MSSVSHGQDPVNVVIWSNLWPLFKVIEKPIFLIGWIKYNFIDTEIEFSIHKHWGLGLTIFVIIFNSYSVFYFVTVYFLRFIIYNKAVYVMWLLQLRFNDDI